MNTVKIRKLWEDYLNSFEGDLEFPCCFRKFDPENKQCGTCRYWDLIDKEGLRYLEWNSLSSDHDMVVNHIQGGKTYFKSEEEGITDLYYDHCFYGWCRRFPPNNSLRSVTETRPTSLLKRIFVDTKRIVSEYCFPLMPHESFCGEWKEKIE